MTQQMRRPGTAYVFWLTGKTLNGTSLLVPGGVAEWLKAAVLKTVVRKYRGFESYLLRHLKLHVDLNAGLTENKSLYTER